MAMAPTDVRAIVIDALGGLGDPDSGEGISRYTDKGWADTLATGVTVVRDTVFKNSPSDKEIYATASAGTLLPAQRPLPGSPVMSRRMERLRRICVLS